jgi:acyl-CoA synthetase (AMP-forming)/AMP-acid ligase II
MSLGSPLIWKILSDYCLEHDINLPSLKHIFMFGAAVPPEVVKRFCDVMQDGKIYTPYGATEALPLTLIDEAEIAEETGRLTETGAGVCVGRPIGGTEIRIIQISENAISTWNDSLPLPPGEIGEIVVKGSIVTRAYLNRPQQTALAKIQDANGQLWHRMGDLGYLDEQGRLWVCGRKSHRVETEHGMLLPIQCEAIFNAHPEVARTALVGVGNKGAQKPVLVVEAKPGKEPASSQAKQRFRDKLLTLGAQFEHTRHIEIILFHPAFPLDVRHNTKIQRHELAAWAAKQIAKRT